MVVPFADGSALAMYNSSGRQHHMTPRQNNFAQWLLCLWLLGAQLYYYLQFKELFLGAAGPLLRRLWH